MVFAYPPCGCVPAAPRLRERRVEGVVRGDAEQAPRRIVDEVRQLLRFLLGKQAAGLQAKLLLDRGDGGQLAEDDQVHAARIDEIRACSKAESSTNPQFCAKRAERPAARCARITP
jgi:hypothetical protein